MKRYLPPILVLALCVTAAFFIRPSKPRPSEKEVARFLDACKTGNYATVQHLLETRSVAALLNARDRTRATPLHISAMKGRERIVSLLIENGADVHAKDKGGATPLFRANTPGIVDALLSAGADVNAHDKSGVTVLVASICWSEDAAVRLIQRGADTRAVFGSMRLSALHLAASLDRIKVAKALIRKGADVNARSKEGRTPLYQAAFKCSPDMLRLLMSSGADVNAIDEDGVSALHVAASLGNEPTVNELLRHGASPNTLSKWGLTPAEEAVRNKHADMAALINRQGAR